MFANQNLAAKLHKYLPHIWGNHIKLSGVGVSGIKLQHVIDGDHCNVGPKILSAINVEFE